MKFSFNTLIYGDNELSIALQDIAATGYDGIEIFPKDIPGSDGSQEIAPELIKEIENRGLEVAAYMGGFLPGGEEISEETAYACEVCRALGADILFQLAPDKATGKWREFIMSLQDMCDQANKWNITVAIHHHTGTLVETVDEMLAMLREADRPNLGICLDTAHCALFEKSVVESMKRLASHIQYIHFKDLLPGIHYYDDVSRKSLVWDTFLSSIYERFVDLGDGSLNFEEIFENLVQDVGYDGWITVEIEPLRKKKEVHLQESLKIMRGLSKTAFTGG